MPELSEEEVMNDDKDPLEAINEIRRAEGVSEDDLADRNDVGVSDSSDFHAATEDDDDKTEEDETKTPDAASDDSESTASVEDEDTKAEDDVDADSDKAPEDAEDEDPEKETGTEKEAEVTSKTFRANGQDFEFSQEEMLAQFETVFGQAMNYTQKMQKIAPYRKMISALEQEGITHDSLNLAIDALKGDKGAISKLMEMNKIDAYDMTQKDEDSPEYTPKDYGKNDSTLAIEEITSKIQGDEEFRITTDVIDNQWDQDSRQAIAENPGMIEGLHNDIKSGVYDKVAPVAMKMKVLDGNVKSDIEYYMIAGQQLAQQLQDAEKSADGQNKVDELNAKAQGAEDEFDKASSEAGRKRSASSTGARSDRKGVIDYLDDDDEAYDEWYKKLTSSI